MPPVCWPAGYVGVWLTGEHEERASFHLCSATELWPSSSSLFCTCWSLVVPPHKIPYGRPDVPEHISNIFFPRFAVRRDHCVCVPKTEPEREMKSDNAGFLGRNAPDMSCAEFQREDASLLAVTHGVSQGEQWENWSAAHLSFPSDYH